jgi:hypothetical protein
MIQPFTNPKTLTVIIWVIFVKDLGRCIDRGFKLSGPESKNSASFWQLMFPQNCLGQANCVLNLPDGAFRNDPGTVCAIFKNIPNLIGILSPMSSLGAEGL